uniref:Rubis-subs-bind domain-containing protein n=1 Tax=Macrostomum lignano TaxID=282301 RepID=A0A1I8HGB2_9PLAT
ALERLVDALQRTDPSQHFAYPPLDAAGASAATVGSRPPTDLHSMRLMIRAGAFRRDLLAMVEAFRRRHARDPALREAAQVMSENLVALESQIVRAANGTNQFGLNPQLLANPDQPEPGTAESAAASTATVKVDQSAAASGCRDSSNQPPTTLTTLTTASQQQQRRAGGGGGGGGMTIGEQVGRLQSGTPCLVGFREDKRNRVAPFK